MSGFDFYGTIFLLEIDIPLFFLYILLKDTLIGARLNGFS
jgi:hypothetical protein